MLKPLIFRSRTSNCIYEQVLSKLSLHPRTPPCISGASCNSRPSPKSLRRINTRLLADNHCIFLFLIPQISHPGSRRARERRAGCTQDGKDATYSRRDNASAAMMLRDRYLMRGNIRVARAGHGGMGHLLVLLLLVGWSQFQRVEGEQQLCESKIFTICIGHHILPLVRQLEGQRQRRLVNAAGDGTRVAARQQGAAATAYVQAGAAVTAYCHSVGQKETCA